MSFCRRCGSPKVLEPYISESWIPRSYSSSDGSMEMTEVCSSQPCEHDGHTKDPNPDKRWWFQAECKCSRCGVKWTPYGEMM